MNKDGADNAATETTGSQPLLESALAAVSQLVREREERLVEGERALQRDRQAFAQEVQRYCGEQAGAATENPVPNDVVRLNVSGTRMEVLRRTLCSVEGSMLASRFSGRWDDNLEKDAEGNFFIDQPVDLFRPLIDFLQRQQTETPESPPTDPPQDVRKRDFLRMLSYYEITHGVYKTKIDQIFPTTASEDNDEKPAEIFFYPDMEMVASPLSTFQLRSTPMDRTYRSFEVLVSPTKVTEFCVGWASPGHPPIASHGNPPRVGTFLHSIALDVVRFGTVDCGTFTQLDRPQQQQRDNDDDHEAALIVRCERVGYRFFVNDRLVRHHDKRDKLYMDTPREKPTITGVGTWKITKVTFDE